MRAPPAAWIGVAVMAASAIGWALGSVLDGGPGNSALGFDAYILVYFALPAGLVGLSLAVSAFAIERPWLWLLSAALGALTVWTWVSHWRGWCCTA